MSEQLHPLPDSGILTEQEALDLELQEEMTLSDLETPQKPEVFPPNWPEPAPISVFDWFYTFFCINIPIAGWIYLLYLAYRKKYDLRRDFAKAFLLYKLVMLIITLIIFFILLFIGMNLLDQLLAYMEML